MTTIVDELVTVRDWLRYAVSRFNRAGLVYGHGTNTALDEAAFLLLSVLDLPIDTLEPWLEARLLRQERQALADVVEARIATRKPAPYLVNAAYIRGHKFYVDERVIVPRSYIGELLADQIDGGDEAAVLGVEPSHVRNVLDLCTGSGCLAILAAEAFEAAHVDAVDISADALAVAKRNVAEHGMDERVRLVRSDLFGGIEAKRYDLIISNPPYVTADAVAAFPPEFRAEPVLAHAGGADGLDLVRRILEGAAGYLAPEGTLIVEIGRARSALEAARPDLAFTWLETETSHDEVFLLTAGDLTGTERPGRRRKRSS